MIPPLLMFGWMLDGGGFSPTGLSLTLSGFIAAVAAFFWVHYFPKHKDVTYASGTQSSK